jgi:hypothetical protein
MVPVKIRKYGQQRALAFPDPHPLIIKLICQESWRYSKLPSEISIVLRVLAEGFSMRLRTTLYSNLRFIRLSLIQ